MTRKRAIVEFLLALIVYPSHGLWMFARDLFGGIIFEVRVLRERLEEAREKESN